MPPKTKKPEIIEEPTSPKPAPPNVFLYIQLASVAKLPHALHPLEIHIHQSDSIIVKCVEQYNTDGIIYQDEFTTKPTYTLIFQQDNLDRINNAVDYPLVIELFFRKITTSSKLDEEYSGNDDTDVENFLEHVLDLVDVDSDVDGYNTVEVQEELILICVGFLDIIKVFGHHRAMIREDLVLYPAPNVPDNLRRSVATEWHLYTLVPIAKKVTFTNMAFVMFESIYNLKEDYSLDVATMSFQLSFRSTQILLGSKDYHVIPWCSFECFTEEVIAGQNCQFFFESFRKRFNGAHCMGLKSNMEVQMHRLFHELMRSLGMEINFNHIDTQEDRALVSNCFHRYILTSEMSNTLFMAFAMRRYMIVLEGFQQMPVEGKSTKKAGPQFSKQKIFEGVLDPAILLFPGVQNIRFAVELKYLGTKKKLAKPKRTTQSSELGDKRVTVNVLNNEPTFAIIKICMLAPLGNIYNELKIFRESFIMQNRLLHCNLMPVETKSDISDLQREAYTRFDEFIRNTVQYIVDKDVHNVMEKRDNFCCALQNLTNILMKIIACDFNIRVRTYDNLEFTNLCVIAFNELELRIHNIVENMEDEGWAKLLTDRVQKAIDLIDSMNTIKLMNAAGDTRMASYIYEMLILNSDAESPFYYYDLIYKMETGRYMEAKEAFATKIKLNPTQDYLVGWIQLYLSYVDTRDDPDPKVAGNATECLLNNITQYAMRNEVQPDGWILLYCYYRQFDYDPGFSFARWKLESLIAKHTNMSTSPYSLWGIMLNLNPVFQSQYGNTVFQCFKTFVRLGLYEFAEIVFKEIENQCSALERYLINTQLSILLNKLPEDFELFNLPPAMLPQGEEELEWDPRTAFTSQVNGNVEYYRGNFEHAAAYYSQNNTSHLTGREFLVSRMRLAYLSFGVRDYQQTIDALNIPDNGKLLPLTCGYLRGKAYYKMDDLGKAMECFIACTTFGFHMPDTWGFLALINLQLGNTLNALLCWKHSRVDPTKRILDETIFTELDLIDVDSVELYIDKVSLENHASPGSSDDETL